LFRQLKKELDSNPINFKSKKKSKKRIISELCVFCVNDFIGKLAISANYTHNPYLIAEEIVRHAYQIESGKSFPRVSDPDECSHDTWLITNSIHVSDFIADTIKEIGSKKIQFDFGPYELDFLDPRQVIHLLSDFDKMDIAFDKHLELQRQWYRQNFPEDIKEINQLPVQMEHAKNFLKKVETDWLNSLEWKKFYFQYLQLEKFGCTFSKLRNSQKKLLNERKNNLNLGLKELKKN